MGKGYVRDKKNSSCEASKKRINDTFMIPISWLKDVNTVQGPSRDAEELGKLKGYM